MYPKIQTASEWCRTPSRRMLLMFCMRRLLLRVQTNQTVQQESSDNDYLALTEAEVFKICTTSFNEL